MTEDYVKKLRILAVDDEEAMLDLYEAALFISGSDDPSRVNYDIKRCKRGEEAVRLVEEGRSKGEPFAVVFLDLRLSPGPDGIWTGEQIRRLDPYVNFVIVTGMLDVDAREIALRIPPEDKMLFVQKPLHLQELRQFASALGAKWRSEMLLREANLALEAKIQELERSRGELMDNQAELEELNNRLMETNNALSVLARNLDRTRKESEKRVLEKTRTLIIPIIEKLREVRVLERHKADLDLLGGYIESLTSDTGSDIKIVAALSTTEMRIASMIKNGMSSQEIADHLFVSLSTVKTHRKNIRRKLDLQNAKVNLRSYLESGMGEN